MACGRAVLSAARFRLAFGERRAGWRVRQDTCGHAGVSSVLQQPPRVAREIEMNAVLLNCMTPSLGVLKWVSTRGTKRAM